MHEHRFWDGTGWTIYVADRGVPSVDSRVQMPAAEKVTSFAAGPDRSSGSVWHAGVQEAGWPPQSSEPVMQPSVPPAGPVMPSGRPRHRTVWLIAAVIVALCAAGFGVAVFALGGSDDS